MMIFINTCSVDLEFKAEKQFQPAEVGKRRFSFSAPVQRMLADILFSTLHDSVFPWYSTL